MTQMADFLWGLYVIHWISIAFLVIGSVFAGIGIVATVDEIGFRLERRKIRLARRNTDVDSTSGSLAASEDVASRTG